jgi:hypothetical protein
MVDGWRAQMLARGLEVDTIKARCRLIARFVDFTNEYPWHWRANDFDQFMADVRSQQKPIALSTLRSYTNAIAMFCSYVSDSRYGWVLFCERQLRNTPSQIVFEWNTPQHTTDDAVPPSRRAFTKVELQHMFDAVDDFVDEAHRKGSKRWLTAVRDSTAFKIGYAYGLRRRELVMLDLTDFGPNPHVPRYGNYGALVPATQFGRLASQAPGSCAPAQSQALRRERRAASTTRRSPRPAPPLSVILPKSSTPGSGKDVVARSADAGQIAAYCPEMDVKTSVDLTGTFAADLHGVLSEAAQQGPLATDVVTGATVVLRQRDLEALAHDQRLEGIGLALFDMMGITDGPLRDWYGRLMFTTEGDYHRRMRSLVSRAFTPRSVEALRATAADMAAEAVASVRPGGDLVAACSTLATRLMCRLLGVPDTDVPVFAAWLDALSPVFLVMTPDQIAAATTAITGLQSYIDELTTRRSKDPGRDLITALLASEADGERLTHGETVAMIANLLVAGHDTAGSQIPCSILVALQHRHELAGVHEDEARLASAVAETIRVGSHFRCHLAVP